MAHAYSERRIFLSLLAGKLATFEQMLLTEYMYITRTFSANNFLGGKVFHIKPQLTLIK